MSFSKQIIFLIILLFLCISIYKDLNDNRRELIKLSNFDQENQYEVIYQYVENGDTLLSIVEDINDQNNFDLDIDIIIQDFKSLNPFVDEYHLMPNERYKFPKYTVSDQ